MHTPNTQAIKDMLYETEAGPKLPKFTSFGCYPLVYLTQKCVVLCAKCATFEITHESQPDDPVSYCDTNWEDPELFCDDCNERIESAYAEPEVTE